MFSVCPEAHPLHTQTHTYAHTPACTRAQTHTRAHTHAHMHTCTHTDTTVHKCLLKCVIFGFSIDFLHPPEPQGVCEFRKWASSVGCGCVVFPIGMLNRSLIVKQKDVDRTRQRKFWRCLPHRTPSRCSAVYLRVLPPHCEAPPHSFLPTPLHRPFPRLAGRRRWTMTGCPPRPGWRSTTCLRLSLSVSLPFAFFCVCCVWL